MYGSWIVDARRRRVASRVRVLLACIASCEGSCEGSCAAAAGGEERLRSNAAVARINLGILAFLSCSGAFSKSIVSPLQEAPPPPDGVYLLLLKRC